MTSGDKQSDVLITGALCGRDCCQFACYTRDRDRGLAGLVRKLMQYFVKIIVARGFIKSSLRVSEL